MKSTLEFHSKETILIHPGDESFLSGATEEL